MTEEFELIISTNKDLEKLNNSKILLTGATGTIGSYLLEFLLYYNKRCNAGIKILCPIRNKLKFHIERCDINTVEAVPYSSISELQDKVDYVIHCAGPTRSADFINYPVDTISAIFTDTQILLDYFKSHGEKAFLYLSSIEIYGDNSDIKKVFSENSLGQLDNLRIRSCYPESKRLAENLCMAYAKQFDLNIKIVRLSQILGRSKGDNRLIAYLCESAINKEPIHLKSDGKSVKSYCYIMDCISAMLTVLVRGQATAYNVANEKIVASVLELSEYINKKYIGKEVIVENKKDEKYPESSFLVMNTDKLKALGWKAHVGMEDAFDKLIYNYEKE